MSNCSSVNFCYLSKIILTHCSVMNSSQENNPSYFDMGDLSYHKTSRPGYQQGSLSRVYKEASNMLEGYCEKKS